MATKELYRRLQLDETASDKDIEAAYTRLKDGLSEDSPLYKELTQAYDVLSDINRRASYDITGKVQGTKVRRRRVTTATSGKIQNVRQTLNSIFMLGAVASVILYVMYLSGSDVKPFLWVCGISLAIKIAEYILRIIR